MIYSSECPQRCRKLSAVHPSHVEPTLVGAVLAGQHDEWTEGRRYLGLDVLARARMTLIDGTRTEAVNDPVTPEAISA